MISEPDPSDPDATSQVDRNLTSWWFRQQSAMHELHARFVPAGDLIVDRWTRAQAFGFGEGSSVYDSALIIGDVTVGHHTWIGPSVILDGSGGLQIGDYCSISAGAQIYSHDSVEWALSGGQTPIRRSGTTVGNNTYVGPNAVVEAGANIGSCCVIGAFALVRGPVPNGHRAFGIPAEVYPPAPREGRDDVGNN